MDGVKSPDLRSPVIRERPMPFRNPCEIGDVCWTLDTVVGKLPIAVELARIEEGSKDVTGDGGVLCLRDTRGVLILLLDRKITVLTHHAVRSEAAELTSALLATESKCDCFMSLP